ncbi:WD repeat-containing protein, partial [Reticulomyxa filosa]
MIKHWIRVLNIKLGWINDFDKFVIKYASNFFMIDMFRSSSKLINTFLGHTDFVWAIDYSAFDGSNLLCSGSADGTFRVWDVDTGKQVQSLNDNLNQLYCVKFSPYHYHNNHRNIICSSSLDNTIHFWDIKKNEQLITCNGHTNNVCGMEFSLFSGGKYLCSGSYDKTIRLWDVEASKSLHVFNGHENT